MNFFTLLSGGERKKTLLTPTPVGKVLPVMKDTTTPQQPRTILDRMDDTAEYLFGQIKCGEPISKQDQKFLTAWLAIKKAQDAIAAGKPIPRCGRAGRRKKVFTGYGK